MRQSNAEQESYRATALAISDLKSAIGASIQWDLINNSGESSSYVPELNSQYIPWFQVSDPDIAQPAVQISYVCYSYRAQDHVLLRQFISGAAPTVKQQQCDPVPEDNAKETIVARGLLPPTPQAPLFSKDQGSGNMLIITLRMPGVKGNVTSIVRRVHIRT